MTSRFAYAVALGTCLMFYSQTAAQAAPKKDAKKHDQKSVAAWRASEPSAVAPKNDKKKDIDKKKSAATLASTLAAPPKKDAKKDGHKKIMTSFVSTTVAPAKKHSNKHDQKKGASQLTARRAPAFAVDKKRDDAAKKHRDQFGK